MWRFFCTYDDPICVKMEKLEILVQLASELTSSKFFWNSRRQQHVRWMWILSRLQSEQSEDVRLNFLVQLRDVSTCFLSWSKRKWRTSSEAMWSSRTCSKVSESLRVDYSDSVIPWPLSRSRIETWSDHRWICREDRQRRWVLAVLYRLVRGRGHIGATSTQQLW